MTVTGPEFVTRQELADLIGEMRADRADVRADRAKLGEEMHADRAEVRADRAELREEMRAGFAEVKSTLATVIDSLADLRNEYHQHTHG